MVGGGGKGTGEGGRDCAVTGYYIQDGGTDSVDIREKELVNDGCDTEGSGGFTPYSYSADRR